MSKIMVVEDNAATRRMVRMIRQGLRARKVRRQARLNDYAG